MRYKNVEMEWLGHATIRLTYKDDVIYIDPYRISDDAKKATLILITHSHQDHCSPEDINKISKENTIIVATTDCATAIDHVIEPISPGEKTQVNDIEIEAVPAYNKDKKFHEKGNGWVGYIVKIGNHRFYHAGDTDLIPEMNTFEVDVAFLPVGGHYTMDAKEAAHAANIIMPDIAIPIHFGSIIGDMKDAKEFESRSDCDVKILKQSQ